MSVCKHEDCKKRTPVKYYPWERIMPRFVRVLAGHSGMFQTLVSSLIYYFIMLLPDCLTAALCSFNVLVNAQRCSFPSTILSLPLPRPQRRHSHHLNDVWYVLFLLRVISLFNERKSPDPSTGMDQNLMADLLKTYS